MGTVEGSHSTGDEAIETLRFVYADLVRERDRLRDARRSVTAQLGPFPASAGLIVGLFAALQPHFRGHPTRIILISVATVIFERQWLTAEIDRLRGLTGQLRGNFDRERNHLLTVQVLLVVEAALLVLSRLVG